jgi:hypothetical protein
MRVVHYFNFAKLGLNHDYHDCSSLNREELQ